MRSLAFSVLTLVFLDELACMAAYAVAGWHVTPLLGVVAAVAAMLVWFLFCSPKARYGGPLVRPIVKVLVFGVGSAALAAAGHPGWAVALLAFSVVVNGAAQLRFVRDAQAAMT